MDRDLAVHLLNVGRVEFSDTLLIKIRGRRILVDGAHSGDLAHIRSRVTTILGEAKPHIDLLVVSRTHKDHIGCLPKLTRDFEIDHALLADPRLGWGTTTQGDPVPVHPAPPARRSQGCVRSRSRSACRTPSWIEELPALRIEGIPGVFGASMDRDGDLVNLHSGPSRHDRAPPGSADPPHRRHGARGSGQPHREDRARHADARGTHPQAAPVRVAGQVLSGNVAR